MNNLRPKNLLSGIVLVCSLFLGAQQGMIPVVNTPAAVTGGCTKPPLTNLWIAATTGCGGGGCLTDSVGGNNATQATGGDQPTYVTNVIGTSPGLSFNGSSDFLTLATGIPASTANYSWWVVMRSGSSAPDGSIFGDPSGNDSMAMFWYTSSQNFVQAGASANWTAYSPLTVAANTNYGLLFTYVAATGVLKQYVYQGSGTFSAAHTSTLTTGSVTAAMSTIGNGSPGIGYYLSNTSIVAMGLDTAIYSSGNITTLGTYINCQIGF